ncbi:MAG TPA: carboxypeptidase-like regulatory domain-containing protein, partial [Candidatus Solibacter sp.]|nr:carboxypeptidase-like regulatory domain-containing protein [Candidatus Solibacter sp.]
MALIPIHTRLARVLAAWIAVSGLMAAEHHGVVKSGGLPIPGATVTATMGDKKLVTTTDDSGRYAFPNLSDGTWTLEIAMLGFAKLTREVGIALDAPSPEWDLKFLPPGAKPTPAPPPPTVPSTPSTTAAVTPAKPAPATTARAATAPAQGRGGRPSLTQANNYQRVDVNASADANAIAGAEGALTDTAAADMSQSADAAFVVNGSVSRGLDMPQQNDWFGGPGGRLGIDGMGGIGIDGMGGDATGAGRGGPGGGRGALAGGGGGFGGGGFGGGGGGFGGRGGAGGGGRGPGRGGQGRGPGGARPGVASFGNGRRNPRAQYNGNAAFTLDNSVWDARSYSVNGQDTAKPGYAKARASVMF